jgi:biotin carboxyl carrier protein
MKMKNYTITVNGSVYDVVVEEGQTSGAPVAAAPAAPRAVPKAAPAPAAAPAAGGAAGSVKIEAGAAGKVFKIEANVGQAVKKGDSVVIVEAMKMEIPVVAPQDGTVASINVAVGDAVEAGALLATLN